MRLSIPFVCIIVLCLALGVLVVWALYNKGDRYLPKMRILASTDGGKSYTEYVSRIPVAADVFFIKYEVAIKASGLWWLVWGNEIPFTLAYPDSFQFTYANSPIEYTCELIGYSNCVPTTDYDAEKNPREFLTLAAKKNQKAEITLRVSKQKNKQDECTLGISFDPQVHPTYRKSIMLDFADYAGNVIARDKQ